MKTAYWQKLDPGAADWRNVLSEYDAVVYEVGPGPVTGALREALVEWPGVIVLRADDVEQVLVDDPRLRCRVLDRAKAIVVHSRGLERRLREEHPWTEIVLVDPGTDPASAALRTSRHWLESVLEAASAEVPGFFPGDRASPWRAEVEELVTLRQTGANVSKRTTRSPG